MMEKNITIVYIVAGMSSRFLGKIKQFAIIGKNNETLIEYSLNQAIKAGFNKIIFVVGNKTEIPFKEKFNNSYKGITIAYALQKYNENNRDKPWGTCDALCSAIEIIKEPFVVCNGDDIYGEESFKILYEHLTKNKENATIGYRLIDNLPDKTPANRAIFKIQDNHVKELVETIGIEKEKLNEKNLNPDDLCSMNFFALHPRTLELLNKKVKEFKQEHKEDRKKECYLPQELADLIRENKIKIKIYTSKEKTLGITCPEDEEIVRNKIKEQINN